MAERRSWTQDQDRVLKYLKDEIKIKKWSQISKKMEFEYKIPGRNGKQCRERYHNHLDSSIITDELTSQEQLKLFKLHDEIGNKWSIISKNFAGRTDNHIKNHFHSKLRKAIRKLNRQSKQYFKKNSKQYKLNLVYKIVEASDFRLDKATDCQPEYCLFFNNLKKQLLEYVGGAFLRSELSELPQKEQALHLITAFDKFDKYFKQKKLKAKQSQPKRPPKSSINSIVVFSLDPVGKKTTSNSEQDSDFNGQGGQKKFTLSVYEAAKIQQNRQIHQNPGKRSLDSSIEGPFESKKQQQDQWQTKFSVQSSEKTNFCSFIQANSNNEKHIKNSVKPEKIILANLIEEEEIESDDERAKSVRSYESMKFFDQSIHGESEGNMMKGFDSHSNFEPGLFE